MKPAPVLKYPGSKWRLADWIISYMPRHTTYLEPFFGSGAVFFNKPPSKVETINDIDGQVVNLFRVIREQPERLAALIEMTPWARDEYYASYERTGDPLEDARRFLVRCWQAYGAKLCGVPGWRHEAKGTMRASTYHTWKELPKRILAVVTRLKSVQIENKNAIDLIQAHHYKDCLIYADPPYPLSTRSGKLYASEMTDSEHMELLEVLDKHPGPVILSCYANEVYDERLKHWQRKTTIVRAEKGKEREEVLWLNPVAVERASYSLFESEGV